MTSNSGHDLFQNDAHKTMSFGQAKIVDFVHHAQWHFRSVQYAHNVPPVPDTEENALVSIVLQVVLRGVA